MCNVQILYIGLRLINDHQHRCLFISVLVYYIGILNDLGIFYFCVYET